MGIYGDQIVKMVYEQRKVLENYTHERGTDGGGWLSAGLPLTGCRWLSAGWLCSF